MNQLTYEEFVLYFQRKNKFPDNSYVSPKGYNESQLKSKYKKYIKAISKSIARVQKENTKQLSKKKERLQKIDEKWERVKEVVDKRDKKQCRLFSILSDEEKKLVINDIRGKFKTVDRAHVFPKSTYKHMKYNSENVVSLFRLFHLRLDACKNPLTDESITNEERCEWWKRIVGEEKYLYLCSLTHELLQN